MFDLKQSIADWRRQMLAAGIKTPVPLDELESHLHEEIERQMKSGLNGQEAFQFSVKKIGQADMLKAEFEKAYGLKEARPGKVIGIACCTFAELFSLLMTPRLLGIACCTFAGLFSLLMAPRLLTIHELSMAERMWGLGAVALTMLSIVSWRFSHNYLPAIRNRRVRIAVGVACGLTGAVWILVFGNLLPNVIVPHVFGGASSAAFADNVRGSVIIGLKDIPPGGLEPVFMIAISILWAMALTAVLGSIAYGLEKAARGKTATADS